MRLTCRSLPAVKHYDQKKTADLNWSLSGALKPMRKRIERVCIVDSCVDCVTEGRAALSMHVSEQKERIRIIYLLNYYFQLFKF